MAANPNFIYDLNPGSAPSLDTLASALSSIRRHALDLDPEWNAGFDAGMEDLLNLAAQAADPETIRQICMQLDELLRGAREYAEKRLRQKDEDMQEILGILVGAADEFHANGDQHQSRLKAFTEQLRSLSRADDLSLLKRNLFARSQELKSVGQTFWSETEASRGRVNQQVARLQEQLAETSRLAATDPLTGLLNRREAAKALEQRIQQGRPFHLVILDLDRFKQVNDNFGHSCGDQILRIFAKKLGQSMLPTDFAARWGGDEFVAVLDADAAAMPHRLAVLRAAVNGLYRIMALGRAFAIPVSATLGIAEGSPADSVEELFARADQSLYAVKKRR